MKRRAVDVLALAAGGAVGLVGAVAILMWATERLVEWSDRRGDRRALGGGDTSFGSRVTARGGGAR
ncbi:MAG TPA: hypothetical protein VFR67_14250 [Pilimelia sp.]|nr:hypothetical protein [Pilimelia sp.]